MRIIINDGRTLTVKSFWKGSGTVNFYFGRLDEGGLGFLVINPTCEYQQFYECTGYMEEFLNMISKSIKGELCLDELNGVFEGLSLESDAAGNILMDILDVVGEELNKFLPR